MGNEHGGFVRDPSTMVSRQQFSLLGPYVPSHMPTEQKLADFRRLAAA